MFHTRLGSHLSFRSEEFRLPVKMQDDFCNTLDVHREWHAQLLSMDQRIEMKIILHQDVILADYFAGWLRAIQLSDQLSTLRLHSLEL